MSRGRWQDVLTDIGSTLGDGQVGAHAPGSALVVSLAACTIRPRGVVFALAPQLPFVKNTAVGMEIALAPSRTENKTS